MDTRSHEAYGGRGEISSLVGDFNRAIADFTRAIELNDENETGTEANQEVEYFRNRALAYGSTGDHHRALADLNMAIDIHEQIVEQTRDPRDQTLWSLRAIAKAELCMEEEALTDANIAGGTRSRGGRSQPQPDGNSSTAEVRGELVLSQLEYNKTGQVPIYPLSRRGRGLG